MSFGTYKAGKKILPMPMTTITLTTDFGLKDHYAALLKGTAISRMPDIYLVDITHNIQPFNIVQAAYVFRNSWRNFPTGTIHFISVNDLPMASRKFLLVVHEGHFFIVADNGLLPLALGGHIQASYALPWPDDATFPLAEIFAHTAAQLSVGLPPEEIGTPQDSVAQRIGLQPVVKQDQIRGSVIYIDRYDNVVVNIDATIFKQIGRQRSFALYFKRHDPITALSGHYSDKPIGEPLCWFNSAGLLEIAINTGRAATLLGLKVDDTVQIDFL